MNIQLQGTETGFRVKSEGLRIFCILGKNSIPPFYSVIHSTFYYFAFLLLRKKNQFDPWVGKIPWKRERLPTPVFWPGEFHGLYSPWGRKESDVTERTWFIFTFSVILPSSCWEGRTVTWGPCQTVSWGPRKVRNGLTVAELVLVFDIQNAEKISSFVTLACCKWLFMGEMVSKEDPLIKGIWNMDEWGRNQEWLKKKKKYKPETWLILKGSIMSQSFLREAPANISFRLPSTWTLEAIYLIIYLILTQGTGNKWNYRHLCCPRGSYSWNISKNKQ